MEQRHKVSEMKMQQDEAALLWRADGTSVALIGGELRAGPLPIAVRLLMTVTALSFPENRDLWDELQRRVQDDIKAHIACQEHGAGKEH